MRLPGQNRWNTLLPVNEKGGLLVEFNPFMYQKHTVAQVSGEKGAKDQPMAPDSSDIFVDTTAQRIWLVATDNLGRDST